MCSPTQIHIIQTLICQSHHHEYQLFLNSIQQSLDMSGISSSCTIVEWLIVAGWWVSAHERVSHELLLPPHCHKYCHVYRASSVTHNSRGINRPTEVAIAYSFNLLHFRLPVSGIVMCARPNVANNSAMQCRYLQSPPTLLPDTYRNMATASRRQVIQITSNGGHMIAPKQVEEGRIT